VLTGYILAAVKDPERLLQEIQAPSNLLVIARPSIKEAIQVVSYVIPMVVLTEHTLPDGEGLDLVLATLCYPSLRQVPIILLGMDDLLSYQWLGITRYLPAQRESGKLNQVLREVLAGHAAPQHAMA